ncbi:lipid asymmetry maintenance ABC transporter permease subunit MlaE [Pseudolysobacter antarcticus]|uniref:Intermembrane phospholipid transport system permease protein MlaE n=1 Tax=Pseudolysobacter antarcticus TaxID=2511995 RepID=A0A411HG22_9GAMM|nr:lipid asymmetry maintenance ABC transporter permease subunit MlaE [Pseudolysobacter antarcticus]QBB69397.1 lipid asymmetry maintenance ABC transporter permease subunit MlaE [Pseudolysobacter antarcticus]
MNVKPQRFAPLSDSIAQIGACTLFLFSILAAVPRSLLKPRLLIQQIYFIGAMSLVIIMTCGLFVGMVLGLQSYNALSTFGATEKVSTLLALSLFRELGPVITVLLFAGRAGTSITAEIGLMRATDQLAAMEMMAVDPMSYVIAPRFLAGVISMPLLASVFNMMGILGGFLVTVSWLGVDSGTFWSNMTDSVALGKDILNGVAKAFAFGIVSTLIAVYQGYTTPATSEGVAYATTRTVVFSSIAILAIDFLMTAFLL